MRVLLTGCDGQLGIEIVKFFNKHKPDYEITKTDIHNLDISDKTKVSEIVDLLKPNAVINCAAYTNVDACEKYADTAYKFNAYGAQNLSEASNKVGATIIHISTDYVFDGTSKIPIKEDSKTNPINIYGKSKLIGEQMVKEANPRHFIFRTAWLYGEGKNFVATIKNLACERNSIDVVDDQTGTPTSTNDLVECISDLISTDYYGMYHATCESQCSWYDFAKKILELLDINSVELRRTTSEQFVRSAIRPKYSVLENYNLKKLNMNKFRHWEESLEKYLKNLE